MTLAAGETKAPVRGPAKEPAADRPLGKPAPADTAPADNAPADNAPKSATDNAPFAVIGVTREGNSCLIGGGNKGAIVDGETIAALLGPRRQFSLTTLKGAGEQVWSLGKPRPLGDDDDCKSQYEQALTLSPDGLKSDMVALSGTSASVTAGLPKSLKVLTVTEQHKTIIKELLAEKGLETVPVVIKQALEADLDGDGKAETILNAVNAQHGKTVRGEYAVLLVVKSAEKDKDANKDRQKDKPAKNSAARQIIEIASEFSLKSTDQPSEIWESTIVGIFDFNNDGKLEIVLYGWFFFGDGWEVFGLENNTAKRLLVCGCGG